MVLPIQPHVSFFEGNRTRGDRKNGTAHNCAKKSPGTRVKQMNPSAYRETEQLAQLGELARPLVHECNNFLNNFLLQLALSEKELPESLRGEWSRLRIEGRELARLLQAWQRHRRYSQPDAEKTDLNQIFRDIAEEMRAQNSLVCLAGPVDPEPIWVIGQGGEVKRLFQLLLSSAAIESTVHRTIEVHSSALNNKIFIRLNEPSEAENPHGWSDFNAAPAPKDIGFLIAVASRSLVEHLGGVLRVEATAEGRSFLAIELPAAL
jgi:signal transduction histidine kinase